MKLLVIGSRGVRDIGEQGKKRILELLEGEDPLFISGGARGADSLAEKFIDLHKIPKHIILPDYRRYGKVAPLVRDREMVDIADYVLAFWDGESRGTKYTIGYAKEQGKPCEVIYIQD